MSVMFKQEGYEFLKTGVISAILICLAGFTVSGAVRLALAGSWSGAETLSRCLLGGAFVLAAINAVLWANRGEWLVQKGRNWGWIVGFIAGMPVMVLTAVAAGVLQRLNASQLWLDAELLRQVCNLAQSGVLPLCALIGMLRAAGGKGGKTNDRDA